MEVESVIEEVMEEYEEIEEDFPVLGVLGSSWGGMGS